jgi:hypothetical protein
MPYQKLNGQESIFTKKYGMKDLGKGIVFIVGFALAMTIKQAIEDHYKAKQLKQTQELEKSVVEIQGRVKNNLSSLSNEDMQQVVYLRNKAYPAILNNLEGQDKTDFLHLTGIGGKLTADEAYMLNVLIQKAKKTMSSEDKAILEQMEQWNRKLLEEK